MPADNRIPILIGITGHRYIRPEDENALRASVKAELERIRALCPASPFVMLSSLAEGGDLLCAEAAAELNIPLIAVLPREASDYENDFSPEAKARFAFHCARALDVFTAPYSEPVPESGADRSFTFRQAGIYVSSHCHVLLALWDGQPGEHGCGTAEAVDFALEKGKTVIHVFTPRGDASGRAGEVRVLGNESCMKDSLAKTDEFNRLASSAEIGERKVLPADCPDDEPLSAMAAVYPAASMLSKSSAGRYRKALALLALFSTALAVAFLLYDEIDANYMIFACGAMLAAAGICRNYASRTACHRRYIEYRALAECLRVQINLRYSGSSLEVPALMTWSQRKETAWIYDALCTLTVGRAPEWKRDICECWVEDQRRYHLQAGLKDGHSARISNRTVSTAFAVSLALYLAALVLELAVPLSGLPEEKIGLFRFIIKISLGGISALTLFSANFYGRLSLPRKLSDHEKMAEYYEKMLYRLEQNGQTDELLEGLAREELIENGNWCSYQRDNKPE